MNESKMNPHTKKNDGGLCDRLFADKGGRAHVQNLMVDAVIKKLDDIRITREELDRICFLKEDELATCVQFEEDHSRMTASIFCRAGAVLGLNLDEVLGLDFYLPEMVSLAVQEMKASNGGLGATSGDVLNVRLERVAPVVLLSKILQEI